MLNVTILVLSLSLLSSLFIPIMPTSLVALTVRPQEQTKVETSYDTGKDKTTVRLSPVQISRAQDKYISLQMSPSFSFPGRQVVTPSIIDFELQTVVRGRLRTDLYVLFIIDREKVFLSSSRWAIKRPVPGRVWVGERLVFRMPYETFIRITKANSFEIKFDGVTFPVGETEKQALRDLLLYMKPGTAGDKSADAVVAPSPY